MNKSEQPQGLDLLRKPFDAHQISKMCRSTKKDNPKGKCQKCGGWHGLPSVQLDYVGHAALTDRLLNADPAWTWEPLALKEGLPALDVNGGMWIKLTVCGVTRLGYGDAQSRPGGDGVKEMIGDALRNAAMRFGAALDLWHKGDLHIVDESPPPDGPQNPILPSEGAKERLEAGRMESLDRMAATVTDCVEADQMKDAMDCLHDITDPDEKVYLWAQLDSKTRSTIKKAQKGAT